MRWENATIAPAFPVWASSTCWEFMKGVAWISPWWKVCVHQAFRAWYTALKKVRTFTLMFLIIFTVLMKQSSFWDCQAYIIINYVMQLSVSCRLLSVVNVWGKRFKLPQLLHESFLTIDYSCKIFFWHLPNWTSTELWCVVLYVTYSTTHQRLVEVQFGRYQKNVLQEWSMVKKLSSVSCGSLKHFPHAYWLVSLTNIDRRQYFLLIL